jgi:D-3-phosphoglycerate dehydrogenase / 2-oxoglutarate reductase
MKVVIADTIHPSLQNQLTEAGYHCVDCSLSSDEVFKAELAQAQILVIRSRQVIDANFIDQFPELEMIARVGAGLEHIDVAHAKSKGIHILSSPEGNRQAVAEHALAMLLSLFNHLNASDAEVRQGLWLRKQNEGIELQGKTVGIVGVGNTGSAFAKVISGFGVSILGYDKYKSGFEYEATMDQLFAEADVVSLHLPMTDETHQLVNEQWLAKFKKPIYLINTARGNLGKMEDLLSALKSGKVLGACLDVLPYETKSLKMPPLDELPETAKQLFEQPNVLLSPHTAGLTAQSYEKLSSILADKVIDHYRA